MRWVLLGAFLFQDLQGIELNESCTKDELAFLQTQSAGDFFFDRQLFERRMDILEEHVNAIGEVVIGIETQEDAAERRAEEAATEAERREELRKAEQLRNGWSSAQEVIDILDNDLVPEVRNCIRGQCDPAVVARAVLNVASRVMVAANLIVPAGPFLASAGRIIASFFIRGPQEAAPPLNFDDVRNAVALALEDQAFVEFQNRMNALLQQFQIVQNTVVGAVLDTTLGHIPTDAFINDFYNTRVARLQNFHRWFTDLEQGWPLLETIRRRLANMNPFSDACRRDCPDGASHVHWPDRCNFNRADARQLLSLRSAWFSFEMIGAVANNIMTLTRTVYAQQGWDEGAIIAEMQQVLDVLILRGREASFLRQASSTWCNGPSGLPRAFTQHCSPSTPWWQTTFEECNYITLHASLCAPERRRCNGAGWVVVGRDQGGPTCQTRLEALAGRIGAFHVERGCQTACLTGMSICARPNACASQQCGRLVRLPNDFRAELTSPQPNRRSAVLLAGESLKSPDGHSELLLRADCHLVLLDRFRNVAWDSKTSCSWWGRSRRLIALTLDSTDGRLVLTEGSTELFAIRRPTIRPHPPYRVRLTNAGDVHWADQNMMSLRQLGPIILPLRESMLQANDANDSHAVTQ